MIGGPHSWSDGRADTTEDSEIGMLGFLGEKFVVLRRTLANLIEIKRYSFSGVL